MAQRAFSDLIGFSRASAAWRFNSSGVLVQDAANVARDDYDPVSGLWNGLLIEEARTNSLRNNSMTGTVSGTPGTMPTYWTPYGQAGLTRQVVGTGTENGIPYVDIRLSGTADASEYGINFDAVSISASQSQSWTSSVFFKLAAGSLAGITSKTLAVEERDAADAFILQGAQDANLAGGPLVTQRTSLTRTLSSASVGKIRTLLKINFTSGAAVDFTLRIGAPQLELGAFATSPILTTNAQATRAADIVAVANTAPWFNPSEGTLYVEAVPTRYAAKYLSIDDGTSNNRIQVDVNASGDRLLVLWGGVTQAQPLTATPATLSTVNRVAAAWKAGDFAVTRNGGAVATASSGSLPTVSMLRMGADTNGTSTLCGWIRAVKYAPRRMTNAELQTMTTLPNANGPTLAFDFKAQTYNLEHI